MKKYLAVILAMSSLAGCTSAPAFDLTAYSQDASIKRIASIMANLKCELWEAANDKQKLPYYQDDPSLALRPVHAAAPDREFELFNIFTAIEYVGEVELTLDVNQTESTNPSLSFLNVGMKPLTIGVNGSLSEKAHRLNTTYHSVDFERLVDLPNVIKAEPPSRPCSQGTELQGELGLKENLQMSLVASAMNDISVWPENASNPGAGSTRKLEDKYSAGQIHAVIDFTTTSTIGGGPTWTTKHFVGPNSSAGLFSHNRQTLNQVSFTFLPICIREKCAGKRNGARWDYSPELPHGTPGWANYLPPCKSVGLLQTKEAALKSAHQLNVEFDSRDSSF